MQIMKRCLQKNIIKHVTHVLWFLEKEFPYFYVVNNHGIKMKP